MADTGAIVHVVLVEWREGVPADVLAQLHDDIAQFSTEIPGVMSVTEGPSVSPEGLEGGFEWGLAVTFADVGSRDGYLDHAAHAPVAQAIGEWAERLVVFDLDA